MGILGFLFGKNGKENAVGEVTGRKAVAPGFLPRGVYLRSSSFPLQDEQEQVIGHHWQEAQFVPEQNAWLVINIRKAKKQLVLENKEQFVRTQTIIRDRASFQEAAEDVYRFERSEMMAGGQPLEDASPATLGNDHVRNFILSEGLVFDLYGKLHDADKGKVPEHGMFANEDIEEVRRYYEIAQHKDAIARLKEAREASIKSLPSVRNSRLDLPLVKPGCRFSGIQSTVWEKTGAPTHDLPSRYSCTDGVVKLEPEVYLYTMRKSDVCEVYYKGDPSRAVLQIAQDYAGEHESFAADAIACLLKKNQGKLEEYSDSELFELIDLASLRADCVDLFSVIFKHIPLNIRLWQATPIESLIEKNRPSHLKLVLGHYGAELANFPDQTGEHPHAVLARCKKDQLLDIFIEAGMKLDVINPEGDCFVHHAAHNDYVYGVEMWQSQGLPIDLPNTLTGRTGYLTAIADGMADAAEAFFMRGADRHARDNEGYDAADIVSQSQSRVIAARLLSLYAKSAETEVDPAMKAADEKIMTRLTAHLQPSAQKYVARPANDSVK